MRRLTPLVAGLLVACGAGESGPGAALAEQIESAATLEAIEFVAPDADWAILLEQARRAYDAGLDTVPLGEAVAGVGRSFLGTPYVAHTLEVPGEERLVVEAEGLDCVTFVETSLALARLVQRTPRAALEDGSFRDRYATELRALRYRDGTIRGYPSRLHYFSEWILDNDRRGTVEHVTPQIGGVADSEAIDFMSTHPDAYRQLAEAPAPGEELRGIERRLSELPRVYIPQDRIAGARDAIRTGDVIAATSTVAGLDIAHTGIAVWVDGDLHLMHAPLADGVVEISARPLAERIVDIGGQDGIMVARPAEVR